MCNKAPFGHTNIATVPKYLYETTDLEGILETEQKNDEELIKESKKTHIKIDTCWNHRCIRYDTVSSWSSALIFANMLSKICIPIAFFGMLIISVLAYLFSSNDLDTIESIFESVFLCTLIPLSIYIPTSLIMKLPPNLWLKSSKGPQWELNRESGMVSIFDYKTPKYNATGKPTLFSKPFIEFEAILLKIPNRHGGTEDSLVLRHRHSPAEINLGGFSQGIREREWVHFWHFIQNYMDISKPLPDIPDFEYFREFDPVTKAYDLQTGRKPRYWRDMSQEEFETQIENPDMYPDIDPHAYPCIIQEHVWLESVLTDN